jgi:hypothetical protein
LSVPSAAGDASPGRSLRGQILKGTEFDLVVNLKTAKALGLTIAQTLLLQADQVIDSHARPTRPVPACGCRIRRGASCDTAVSRAAFVGR